MLACIFAKNRNCTASDDGPYKVISRSGRIMKILMKGKVETVSVDRGKPAHLECAPDTGDKVEHKTQQKTTNSKTAWITRATREESKGSSSKITPKSLLVLTGAAADRERTHACLYI